VSAQITAKLTTLCRRRNSDTELESARKEARETKFFIRMIVRAVPEMREEAKPLWQEAKELHLIFAKIYRR